MLFIKKSELYAMVQELEYKSECSYLMEGYTCSRCGVITRPCPGEIEIMQKLRRNICAI